MIRRHSGARTLRSPVQIAGDSISAVIAVVVAVQLRRYVSIPGTELLPVEKFPLDWFNMAAAVASLIVSLAATGFYTERVTARHRPSIVAAVIMQIALLALISTGAVRLYARTILLGIAVVECVLVVLWRRLLRAVYPAHVAQAVLVGSARRIRDFMKILSTQREGRVAFSGYLLPRRDPDTAPHPHPHPLPCLGRLGTDAANVCLRDAEEVVVLDDDPSLRLEVFAVRGPIGYLAVPSHAESLVATPIFGAIGDQPVVEIAARSAFGAGKFIKRLLDLAGGLLLLLIALPLMGLIAIAIALESGLPIFIGQPRCGRRGRPFVMAKFRSMYRPRAGTDDLALSKDGDERVTRVGAWLRRHRLDELPQLFNVLRGDMSLVGPRPERTPLHEELLATIEGFGLRLLVLPGLTGLAQVSSDYETAPATKLRYDIAYICGWSVWLDVRIMLQSVSTAMSGGGR